MIYSINCAFPDWVTGRASGP